MITIVGGGLAGLCAAKRLHDAGKQAVVLEAEAHPGGRLATDVLAGATFDHGAQFFTARGDAFTLLVEGWLERGWVREWCRGFGATPDGHPRFAAVGGMARLAAHLAAGLDVRCASTVSSLAEAQSRAAGHGVILTPPLPVTARLAPALDLPEVRYEPTLALLVSLDEAGAVPEPGGAQPAAGPFRFVADNLRKGVSAAPGLTLHADGATSRALWGLDDATATAELLVAATPWLGDARATATRLVRWEHATPLDIQPEPCLVAAPGVIVAGDAFDGPRMEGAARSGLAAADALLA